ncbi:kinesin-like protein KIF21B isoform X1 [Chrysemys picta bellii]|uniref:kinesin-like protein KIF21B isoform X1 n=1 Tax=Chrysemys picta bellii TaxID=8478 RepID=UPI0032B2671E
MECYTEEKANKIKADYEKRLKEMNRDLQKLQAAQKERARLLKNQSRYERELKKLQAEVAEMKKAKVPGWAEEEGAGGAWPACASSSNWGGTVDGHSPLCTLLMLGVAVGGPAGGTDEADAGGAAAEAAGGDQAESGDRPAEEGAAQAGVSDPGAGVSEAAAGNRAAKENPGGLCSAPPGQAHVGPGLWEAESEASHAGLWCGGSTSTTSLEPESGSRSVSSIVRQWNRKIDHFLEDPLPSVNGARPIRKKFPKKGMSQTFSKAARLKWQLLERRIFDVVMQRMTIVNLEADMERLIKKREELALLHEALQGKRGKLQAESPGEQKGLQS